MTDAIRRSDALKSWRRSAEHEAERREVEEEDRRLAEERKTLVRDGPKLKGAKLAARLDATWGRPPGFIGRQIRTGARECDDDDAPGRCHSAEWLSAHTGSVVMTVLAPHCNACCANSGL